MKPDFVHKVKMADLSLIMNYHFPLEPKGLTTSTSNTTWKSDRDLSKVMATYFLIGYSCHWVNWSLTSIEFLLRYVRVGWAGLQNPINDVTCLRAQIQNATNSGMHFKHMH